MATFNETDVENDEYQDAEEGTHESEAQEAQETPDLEDTIINIDSPEYKIYRANLLGKDIPDRSDDKCEFYLLNNVNQIKKFVKIKSCAVNSELNEEHIRNMVRQIEDSNELYFPNSIAVIEYKKYSSNTPKNIIELVDGHHRIECLKHILTTNTIKKISFWVQIYKAYKPESKKANVIFKLYNTIKPFKVNFEQTDFKLLLVVKLNEVFKTSSGNGNAHFIFIKDSINSVYKPSIQKKLFCDKLEIRINEQIQATRKDLIKDMITNIINKFQSYNKSLLKENLAWFNNDKETRFSGKITENQYKNASANKCMLGLVKIDFLMYQCVNL
jgi:hypothetical protein